MSARSALMSAALMTAFAMPAFADDDNTISLPPAGTTIINLSVTERTKLPQDTLSANLNFQLDGTSPTEIQDKINKAMTQALATAKTVTAVKTTTGSYYVYEFEDAQVDPQTGKQLPTKKKWRGQQSIGLESKDSSALLDLAGKIQTMGFTMQGLNYSLSDEKADEAHDQMLDKALRELSTKAKAAASALGKGNFDILEVNTDGSQSYQPMYREMKTMAMAPMASDAAVSAPVASAGDQDLALTVNARVLLKP